MRLPRIVDSEVFQGLWDALWSHRRRTFAALALLVLAKVAAVGVPLLLKAVVDRFSTPNALVTPAAPGIQATLLVVPTFLLLGYAALRFASTLFTELRDLLFARVTKRTVMAYAERTFAHLLALSPKFHVQRNTGALIRDVERGTAGVGFLLGAGLFTIVPTLVEFIAVLVVMTVGYSAWFALIIVVTFFLYAGYTTVFTERRALHQRRVNEIDSRAHGRMVDSLLNYETVKTHARERFERERYAQLTGEWIENSVANQQALSLLHIGQSAIIAFAVAAVMLLAADKTLRGEMTVGDLVLVNAYVIQICLPLNALGFVFREARDALVNTEKLFALLRQPVEIEDAPTALPLQVRGGAVRFEHVDFSYEAGRQVLSGVDFEVGAGRTTAVVGGSGSGKSTLARLLLRLYDADAGRVSIDGQDLRQVSLSSLREAIGVVPQDTVLFNDTIAYNIGYGRHRASLPEIIDAAKAAQVHEFIVSLPAGYDTVVGERGLKLSGGEKQRIAIARAFLKNPPILIFDEATSALDTRAERAIQGELDRIAQGRTTLVIAHRLSTIVDADEIVVMDKGRIVERGRHDALLAREGLYAQLWNLQRQQQQFERLERQMARQAVDLVRLVGSLLDALTDAFEQRAVRLDRDFPPDPAVISADPGALSQALHALCVAALHATPRGGSVSVSVLCRDAHVHLVVMDGRHDKGDTMLRSPGARVSDGPPPFDPLELRSVVERHGGRFEVTPAASTHGLGYQVALPLTGASATR